MTTTKEIKELDVFYKNSLMIEVNGVGISIRDGRLKSIEDSISIAIKKWKTIKGNTNRKLRKIEVEKKLLGGKIVNKAGKTVYLKYF